MFKKVQVVLFFFVILSLVSLTSCKKKPPQIDIPSPAEPAPVEPTLPPEPPPTETQTLEEGELTDEVILEVTRQLRPVFFDFDKFDIREDQIENLQNNARVLKQYPKVHVLIEGHCDERGTDEYNLALGERRARAAKDYLVSLGIEESRLSTISYGESKPFAEGHNEEAWQQNRRAHFVAIKR